MRENVRSGRFTAEHYRQMWSSRLELQADEYFEHAPAHATSTPKASAAPKASAEAEAEATAVAEKTAEAAM